MPDANIDAKLIAVHATSNPVGTRNIRYMEKYPNTVASPTMMSVNR